jgi:hypothetical protein
MTGRAASRWLQKRPRDCGHAHSSWTGRGGGLRPGCLPSFDRLRYRRGDGTVFLFAFDLLELNGDDLRREPLEVRKATLASVLAKAGFGLRLNEHLEHHDGELVFRHALQAWPRGHREQAARLALSLRAVAGLAQDEEPCSTGREARGGRELGQERTALT